jgi:hypothetical protein
MSTTVACRSISATGGRSPTSTRRSRPGWQPGSRSYKGNTLAPSRRLARVATADIRTSISRSGERPTAATGAATQSRSRGSSPWMGTTSLPLPTARRTSTEAAPSPPATPWSAAARRSRRRSPKSVPSTAQRWPTPRRRLPGLKWQTRPLTRSRSIPGPPPSSTAFG